VTSVLFEVNHSRDFETFSDYRSLTLAIISA